MDHNAVFLVVDDFDAMCRATVNQLHSMGFHHTLTASNGAEALQILRQHKVQVVLSDWNMPVLSGLELFQAMRADPALAEIPFVMITAEAERRQISEAVAAGVTELIVKPYAPQRLLARIEKVLSPDYRNHMRAAALARKSQLPGPLRTQGSATGAADGGQAVATREMPQILIVDDTPENLMLLSHLFRKEYAVRLAQNGNKALELCQGDSPPDLVLLDVMMPGISGFEVLQRMREHPVSENIPVIFVTSKNEEADRALGLQLGAVDYITKPVNPSALQLRVGNFMRFVQLRRQMQASFDDMVELARLHEHVEQIARHDVKGPIAAAMGLLQEVIREGCEHSDELGLVMQALQSALQTVSLSADLFKIESGTYPLRAQALAVLPLVTEVIQTHRSLWQHQRLRNRVVAADDAATDTDPKVLGEAALCRVILQNLLKNAWEASPPDGDVVLSWKVEAQCWTARISNSGVVPPAIRDRFFDKYVTSGKADGTGLGTYSARLLTDVQHGTLRFEVDDTQHTTTLIWSMPLAGG